MGWEEMQTLQLLASSNTGFSEVMIELTAMPVKSLLSSRNLFVPRRPAIPSVAPGFLGGVLHFKSQQPPPLTVLIQYASSAPKLTKHGASAPFAFQVVFQTS
jgi:hypothetical protein